MEDWLEEVELTGQNVKLVPLQSSHKEALLDAASDGELWKIWYTSVPSAESIEHYLETAFSEQKAGSSLPFVVLNLKTNKIIGCTRYCNIDEPNKRLEIGYTWYAKSSQRTGVNTECKHLLLQHAFEQLNCIAVEFRTNWFNYRSRNAILRLGAKQDGVLRSHRVDANRILRDTVVFSIIQMEWPVVKKSLEYEMGKYR